MKDTIYTYCKTVRTHDLDHLQNALENASYIETGKYEQMNGCPSSYGLEEHVGICEIEDTEAYTHLQLMNMCDRCWKNVLEE